MRANKIVTLMTFTLAITAIMLILKSGSVDNADNQMRKMFTQSDIQSICAASINDPSLNYTQIYEKYIANASNTLSNLFQVKSNSESVSLLIDFVKTNDQNQAIQYGWKRAAPYLVFIAFAVISLISWIFYFCCCCCPCCCCKKNENDGCCRCLSLIILLAAYIGIVIGCIIGFSYSSSFVKSLNGTTCSFLMFYSDVVDGESTNNTPKWIGINGITKVLSDTQSALDKVSQAYPNAFSSSSTSWTKTDPQSFVKSLTSSFNMFNGKTLANPNPASSKKGGVSTITPIYIATYGDYTTNNTALNVIYQEFNAKISGSITFMDQAKQYSSYVDQYMSQIKGSISSIQSNVNTLNSAFSSISTNVIDNWIDAQSKANDAGILAFLVLFAILISLACISVICLFFFAIFCNIKCLRFILHIVWNLTTLIMILTFLLGGVFGIIGLVGTDGVPVMQWIFGTENLSSASPKIVTDATSAGYVNTCINGNGDLSKLFISSGSNTNYLDQLYQVSYTLSSTRALIKNNTNSIAISTLNDQYKAMISDISLTTQGYPGENSIQAMISQANGWSDVDQNLYQKGCSSSAYDAIVSNVDNCPSGYTYSAAGGSLGGKNCLLYSDFTGSQMSSRYSTVSGCSSSGSTDFTSVSSALSAYTDALNGYSAANKALINQIIAQNDVLNQSFVNMSAKLLANLDQINGVISPLNDLFQNIVGSNGLFTLINCKFMGNDLNVFYTQLQDNLAPNSSSLGGIIIAVSFLEAISVFFLLIVINKYAAKDKKEEENAEPKSA